MALVNKVKPAQLTLKLQLVFKNLQKSILKQENLMAFGL